MAIKFNREAYDKVFTDLEGYKEFCALAWTYGYRRSYTFDERDLYNNRSEAWRNYTNFLKGKRPRWNAKDEKPKNFNRGKNPRFNNNNNQRRA